MSEKVLQCVNTCATLQVSMQARHMKRIKAEAGLLAAARHSLVMPVEWRVCVCVCQLSRSVLTLVQSRFGGFGERIKREREKARVEADDLSPSSCGTCLIWSLVSHQTPHSKLLIIIT